MIRIIGEELKGYTHRDKPYVAKKTILHAVWRQNEVILAPQAKILEMVDIEARIQLTMNDLQKEVRAFGKTAKKVENMNVMLKVKMPILNRLNETVDVHGEAITQVSNELARKSSSLALFKGETRSPVSKSKRGLIDVTKTVKALPSTIRISSRHVWHSTDNFDGWSSYDVDGEGEEVLADMISQQDRLAILQADNANCVEESVKSQFLDQKQVQIHLREEVRNAPRVEGTPVKRWTGYNTRQKGGGGRDGEIN